MLKIFKKRFFKWLFLFTIAGIISFGFVGCKSQKKIAAEKAAAERTQKIDQAKTDLLAIINDRGNMTISEKEDKVSEIKGMNLQDPEVDALIIKVEDLLENERLEQRKIEDEKRKKEKEAKKKEEMKFNKIEYYFQAIANSKSLEMANTKINEALKIFASADVPVLIIISQEGGINDYDRPTNIKNYLEYIKDQKKSVNKIHNVEFDENGKIIELELIKM